MERRIDRLTPRERELLRHVYLGRTTDEIAHLVGLRPKSVDKRIDAARNKLGNVPRRVAAALLAEAEGWGEKTPPREIPLFSSPREPANGALISTRGQPSVDRQSDVLQSEGAAFVQDYALRPSPRQSGRRNQEDTITRIGGILIRAALLGAITVAFILAFSALR